MPMPKRAAAAKAELEAPGATPATAATLPAEAASTKTNQACPVRRAEQGSREFRVPQPGRIQTRCGVLTGILVRKAARTRAEERAGAEDPARRAARITTGLAPREQGQEVPSQEHPAVPVAAREEEGHSPKQHLPPGLWRQVSPV